MRGVARNFRHPRNGRNFPARFPLDLHSKLKARAHCARHQTRHSRLADAETLSEVYLPQAALREICMELSHGGTYPPCEYP